MKHHGGTHHVQGVLRKGTQLQPSPQHGGSGVAKGTVHAPRPQVYQNHGGTSARQGVLKRK